MGNSQMFPEGKESQGPYKIGSVVRPNYEAAYPGYAVVVSGEDWVADGNLELVRDPQAVYVRHEDGSVGFDRAEDLDLVREGVPQAFPLDSRVVGSYPGATEGTVVGFVEWLDHVGWKYADPTQHDPGGDAVYYVHDDGVVVWDHAKTLHLVELEDEDEVEEDEVEEDEVVEDVAFAPGSIVQHNRRYAGDNERFEVVTREEYVENVGWDPHRGASGITYVKVLSNDSYSWNYDNRFELVSKVSPKWEHYPIAVGTRVSIEGCGARTMYTVVTKEEYLAANMGEDYSYGEEKAVFAKDDDGKVIWEFVKWFQIEDEPEPEAEPKWDDYPFPVGSTVFYQGCGGMRKQTVITKEEYLESKDGQDYSYGEKDSVFLKDSKSGEIMWSPKGSLLSEDAVQVKVDELLAEDKPETIDGFPVGTKLKHDAAGGDWTVIPRSEFVKEMYKDASGYAATVVYVRDSNGRAAFDTPSRWMVVSRPDVWDNYPFSVGSTVYYEGCGGRSTRTVVTKEQYLEYKGGVDYSYGEKDAVFVKSSDGEIEWDFASSFMSQEQVDEKDRLENSDEPAFPVGTRLKLNIDNRQFDVISKEEFIKIGGRKNIAEYRGVFFLKDKYGSPTYDYNKQAPLFTVVEAEAELEVPQKYPVGSRVYADGCGRSYFTVISRQDFIASGGRDSSYGEKNILFLRSEKRSEKIYWDYDTNYHLADEEKVEEKFEVVSEAKGKQKFAVGTKVVGGDEVLEVVSRQDYIDYHGKDLFEKDDSKVTFVKTAGGRIEWDYNDWFKPLEEQPKLVDVPAEPVTVTAESEGRLNVPAEMLRSALGVRPGDRVYVQFLKDKLVLTRHGDAPNIEKSYTVTVRGNIRISREVVELIEGHDNDYQVRADGDTVVITAANPSLLDW